MSQDIIDFADAKARLGDHIVRGTAAGGYIRAVAITARKTVQTARSNHNSSPLVTAALGSLMMGGQMMGVLGKNEGELVTLIVRGDGPIGGLTVTANNKGQVKGYAIHPNVWLPLNSKSKLDVGTGIGRGTLTVVHDQPGFEPYSSQVELASGEIGDDLTYYFAVSDQIPTSVGVGVLVDIDTSVRQAGGFIVQLMPGYGDELAAKLEDNLKGITSVTDMLEEGLSPNDMLLRVLDGLDYQELEAVPAEFRCGCNEGRAKRVVLALGRAELEDMIQKHEPAETTCAFCGKTYVFSPDQLQELLDQSEAAGRSVEAAPTLDDMSAMGMETD